MKHETVTGASPEQEAKCRELLAASRAAEDEASTAEDRVRRAEIKLGMARVNRDRARIAYQNFIDDYWSDKDRECDPPAAVDSP